MECPFGTGCTSQCRRTTYELNLYLRRGDRGGLVAGESEGEISGRIYRLGRNQSDEGCDAERYRERKCLRGVILVECFPVQRRTADRACAVRFWMCIVIFPFEYLCPESEIRERKNECNEPEPGPARAMMVNEFSQAYDNLQRTFLEAD